MPKIYADSEQIQCTYNTKQATDNPIVMYQKVYEPNYSNVHHTKSMSSGQSRCTNIQQCVHLSHCIKHFPATVSPPPPSLRESLSDYKEEGCVSCHGHRWSRFSSIPTACCLSGPAFFHFYLMRLALARPFIVALSSLSLVRCPARLLLLPPGFVSDYPSPPPTPPPIQLPKRRPAQRRCKPSQHSTSGPSSIIHLSPLMSFPSTLMYMPQLTETLIHVCPL